MSLSRRHFLARGVGAGAGIAALAAVRSAGAADGGGSAPVYLFAHFHKNGQTGMHLAYSRDGYEWKSLNNDRPLLVPRLGEKLMRDPCVLRGADGTFHMVWTTGWWDMGFGYASSKDLIHWSEQRDVPVNEKTRGAQNTWAPELFYDKRAGEFLVIWATTVPGRFPETDKDDKHNHRLYFVRTKDFAAFSEPQLFYDPGFSSIDATIVEVGDELIMVYKDERPKHKCLRLATAKAASGPWTTRGEAIGGDWIEGPSILKVGDAWMIYFDHYRDPRFYGALRTTDWRTFEDVTKRTKFPHDFRHGTAFEVTGKVLVPLLAM